MEKITYVSVLAKILNHEDLDDVELAKIAALKEREEKRSHANPDKPTKKQKENKNLAETILTIMRASGEPHTVSEWKENSEILADYSIQKLSAIFRQLENSGKVVKTTEKRKSYFRILEEA